MIRKLTKGQQEELDRLRKKHRLLSPERVVGFASDPETELHKVFTWDDGEAAKQWRLEQARHVIRVSVYFDESVQEPVRAFVSLSQDRGAGGGYRHVPDVLRSDKLREQMLAEALKDMQIFARKYRLLKELRPVFDAVDRVMKKHGKAGKRHSGKEPVLAGN